MLLWLTLSCTSKLPPPPDSATTTQPTTDSAEATETSTPDDTEITDTGTIDPPDVVDASVIDPDTLTDCLSGVVPAFDVATAQASPEIASVPVAVADSVSVEGEVTGLCVRQRFAGGGVLTRCRMSKATPALYVQGAPAPGQEVSLELGVVLGDDDLCWSGEALSVSLGEPYAVEFEWSVPGEALETVDYPPVMMAAMGDQGPAQTLYALALADSPSFGVAAGDVLWALKDGNFQGYISEIQALDNGLLVFTGENEEDLRNRTPFDPEFRDAMTVSLDRAGLRWSRTDRCDASDPEQACFGFVHHGNASVPSANLYLTNSYELLEEDGEPVVVEDDGVAYTLIGSTFNGYRFVPGADPESMFSLSFREVFGVEPTDPNKPGPSHFEGPDGEQYQTAYYVNAVDARADRTDPELAHLTGTLTVNPYTGFFHAAMTPEGEVLSSKVYCEANAALTWDTSDGRTPLTTGLHNAELIDREPGSGALHFMAYDRNASGGGGAYQSCSGFYHMVDRGGAVEVGGPYHTVVELPDAGEVCGNSWSYGNGSVLHDVLLSGSDTPVSLVVVSDNLAVAPEDAHLSGTVEELYAPGTPRLVTIFANTDPLDPHGWTPVSALTAENINNLNSVGFGNVMHLDPYLMIATEPFELDDLSR